MRNNNELQNRFLFGGRILNPFWRFSWPFIVMNVQALAIIGIWASTTAVWWLQSGNAVVTGLGSYLCLISLSCMYVASMKDPGFLPLNLDPNPPRETSRSDQLQGSALRRDIKVRSEVIRVNYCQYCRTYRSPRSSHCRECGVCVDRVDHHCQWFNNCIGNRNYTPFFVFLITMTISYIFIIATAAIHLGILASQHHLGFRHAIQHGVGSGIVFCLAWLPLGLTGIMMTYHVRLALLNLTTIEEIRSTASRSLGATSREAYIRAYSNGSWYQNILAVLCRPQSLSWLNEPVFVAEGKGMSIRNTPSDQPLAACAHGAVPLEKVGVHCPREIVRIARDYEGGVEAIRFATAFSPMEIESRISHQQFAEIIGSINDILASAESLRYSILDNVLRVLTLQFSSLFYRTHYEREMQRLQHHIEDQNHKFLNAAGLNILSPRKVAFLFLEIECYISVSA